MYISVIIPAYNEAKRIKRTLLSVHDYLSKQQYDYEILVVDDGSKDTTTNVVRDMAPHVSHLRVIYNKENHGKGWAVRQGMLQARGEYRLFMDADNSTSIDQVDGMLPFLEKAGQGGQGYDIVIGSRRIKGSRIAVKQPWIRDFLGGIFRTIVHTLVPLGLKDSQTGFKIFSAESALVIFSKQSIFRWAFDVEILAIAGLKGFKIKEAPIVWTNDQESHVKLGGMVSMLLEVVKIRLNLWDEKYS